MGHTYTPRYRVRERTQDGWQTSAWRGAATPARAEAYRQASNQSYLPGGVNYHLSLASGYILHASRIQIIRQSSGVVVAEAYAPSFEIA